MSNTDSNILKPKFTLIEGGLNCSIPQAHKRFVSAYVTNTRLMGVLAVYAHWAVKDGGDIHQFFYIDCEETGLETCTVYRGDWNQEMQMAEQALVGGLGAQKLPLTAKTFRWLMGYWRHFNRKHDIPLPPNKDNYEITYVYNSLEIQPAELTITASASKRAQYIRWAFKTDAVIIEDDYDSEFSILKKPEDTLFSLEPEKTVIYINTFSGTIASSLRIGYMVLPAVRARQLKEKVDFYACSVPVFEQYVLAQLIENGDFERHINRVRRIRRRMREG